MTSADVVLGAILGALLALALAAGWPRRRSPAADPEPVRRFSPTYALRFYSDRDVPVGLVARVEDALWALAFAGEQFGLWDRRELRAWAEDRRLAVTILEGPPASYAVADGVVLYLPRDPKLWTLTDAGLVASFARLFVGEVPTDTRFWRAVAHAFRIHDGIERGEAVPEP